MSKSNLEFVMDLDRQRETLRAIKAGQVTAEELQRLRDQLTASRAHGEAMHDLNDEVIQELSAADAGNPELRRLSDPKNRDQRAKFVAEREDEHLRRLSGGRLRLKKK